MPQEYYIPRAFALSSLSYFRHPVHPLGEVDDFVFFACYGLSLSFYSLPLPVKILATPIPQISPIGPIRTPSPLIPFGWKMSFISQGESKALADLVESGRFELPSKQPSNKNLCQKNIRNSPQM